MISGKAKLAGVMGWPVSHTRSPTLHNYWLNNYGIDGAYVPLAVAPDDLNDTLRALPKLGFRGVNLTIPHKEAAMGMMDALEDSAQRIGAVNTVIVEDGALIGANTDAYGFLENLKSGCDLSNYLHAALVVGAGGASRAVIAALMDAGAKSIYLTNRTREKSDALLSAFPSVQIIDWNERHDILEVISLLVNSTSQGMEGQGPLDLSLDALPQTALVTDLVYTPLITPLLAEAKKRGNPIVDGFGMLLHQATPGFERWFGVRPEVTPLLRERLLS